MKKRANVLFSLLLLCSCSGSSNKDAFIKDAIIEKIEESSYELIDYSISREETKDDVTTLFYDAKVRKDSISLMLKDSLFYTVTGDGLYIFQ